MADNQVPQPGDGPLLARRSVLKGFAGAAGLAAFGPLAAACGGSSGGSGSGSSSGTVTFGSNASDTVPKKAYQSVFANFTKSAGTKVDVNTVDHNTFQDQINSYLQGRPQDVFTWFAGYRMQFFAKQGLATPIDDVWAKIGADYSDALKAASKGEDGKYYFVPFYYYPWAFFYRKSVWQQHGYEVPRTLDELRTLAGKMKTDGLTPIAFADKDGWPAMGTFDYLNMRANGYDFHIALMKGQESWTDPKVAQVFDLWRGLLPFMQTNALGRTWQEAAQSLQAKQSGMYLLGMFVGQQFTGADHDDLDFFPFPEVNSSFGQDAVEAPIDGFMMAKKAKNTDAAVRLLTYLGGPQAQNTYLKSDPNNIATNSRADTSGYSALQKKAVQLIGSAKHISQFMDRDTRPDFAQTVMISSLQKFIQSPNDIAGLTKSIETQKQQIFTA